mmetsp:Transcript_30250/g.100219  ORF Transcript_30250/g.100219 Transcript_30250/m.100219 type:complete len:353 (+) Transcript_30250:2170-3228(+)
MRGAHVAGFAGTLGLRSCLALCTLASNTGSRFERIISHCWHRCGPCGGSWSAVATGLTLVADRSCSGGCWECWCSLWVSLRADIDFWWLPSGWQHRRQAFGRIARGARLGVAGAPAAFRYGACPEPGADVGGGEVRRGDDGDIAPLAALGLVLRRPRRCRRPGDGGAGGAAGGDAGGASGGSDGDRPDLSLDLRHRGADCESCSRLRREVASRDDGAEVVAAVTDERPRADDEREVPLLDARAHPPPGRLRRGPHGAPRRRALWRGGLRLGAPGLGAAGCGAAAQPQATPGLAGAACCWSDGEHTKADASFCCWIHSHGCRSGASETGGSSSDAACCLIICMRRPRPRGQIS